MRTVFHIRAFGDKGVGKSSLIMQYQQEIENLYRSNNNLSFISEPITTPFENLPSLDDSPNFCCKNISGKEVNLLLSSLGTNLNQTADIVLLVYDITNSNSFDHISRLYEDVKTKVKPPIPSLSNDDIVYVLVGNKVDLADVRSVDVQEGRKLAGELGCSSFIEVSAKTKKNLNNAFDKAITTAMSKESAAIAPETPTPNSKISHNPETLYNVIKNIRSQYKNLGRRVQGLFLNLFGHSSFNPKREKTLDKLEQIAQTIIDSTEDNTEKTKLLIGLLVYKKDEAKKDHKVDKNPYFNTQSRLASCIGLVLKQYEATYNLEECKTAYLDGDYHTKRTPSLS